MNKKAILYSVLRSSLAQFIQKTFNTIAPGETYLQNWHIEAIAYHLELCIQGGIKRLIITLPPRSLKSIAASVAFPAFVLGQDPSRKIIAASYSQELASKFSKDTRRVMQSDWYKAVFPRTHLQPGSNAINEFVTTRQGFRYTTSVGGTLTGRGGNFIIIDDPHKVDEVESDLVRQKVIDWFQGTLLSRLDNKQEDVIIVIQQRLHENDLAGFLLESGEWTHLNLPAIAEEKQSIPIGKGKPHTREEGDLLHPKRDSLEVLNSIKATIGSYKFAAQYQQNPAPLGGGMIKWDWFKRYEAHPVRKPGEMIVQSWDTASTASDNSDYSVCTTWLCKGNHFYLLEVLRERLEYPDLKRRIICHAEQHKPDLIIIEAANSGIPLWQEISTTTELTIRTKRPDGDKVSRMRPGTALIEAGRVLLPEEAPWLAEFQREVVHFPNGKHDDQIDSLSQFLWWVRDRGLQAARLKSRVTIIRAEPAMPSISDLFNTPIW